LNLPSRKVSNYRNHLKGTGKRTNENQENKERQKGKKQRKKAEDLPREDNVGALPNAELPPSEPSDPSDDPPPPRDPSEEPPPPREPSEEPPPPREPKDPSEDPPPLPNDPREEPPRLRPLLPPSGVLLPPRLRPEVEPRLLPSDELLVDAPTPPRSKPRPAVLLPSEKPPVELDGVDGADPVEELPREKPLMMEVVCVMPLCLRRFAGLLGWYCPRGNYSLL